MPPGQRAVERLVEGKPMRPAGAEQLVRDIWANALQVEADIFDGTHVGLFSAFGASTLLRQHADAVRHGDPIGGAA